MYNGLVRAIAEICAGIVCYNASKRLSNLRLTGGWVVAATLLETFGYAITILYAIHKPDGPHSIALVFWLMTSIVISFSGVSVYAGIFTSPWCARLGRFSLMLYLTHEVVKNKILRPMGYNTLPLHQYLMLFFGLTIVLALICQLAGNAIIRRTYPTTTQSAG